MHRLYESDKILQDNHWVAPMVSLLANILITTTKKANDFCVFVYVYKSFNTKQDKTGFIKFFKTSEVGGFFPFKTPSNTKWIMNTHLIGEEAVQATFHGMFSTFKGILEKVTNGEVK